MMYLPDNVLSKSIKGLWLWCLTSLSTIIQWWSVLLVEETGGPGENYRPNRIIQDKSL